MSVDTTRVLRIGVVWRSQVVAERVLDRRVDVSVGSRPDCTVAVTAKDYPGFPAHVQLAVVSGGQYHIVLPPDPAHKLVLRGGPAGSDGVDKSQVKTINGNRVFPIETFTGGSVALGDLIIMFQFVRGDAIPTITREETVLRIGLVHDDRLLSDEIFHGNRPVIIGVGPTKTISLPDVDYKGADASFTFDKSANKFAVKIPKDSVFRLALDGQAVVDNKDAVQKGVAKQAADGITFDLPLKARGRATMGPYTVLFQVVKQSVTVPTFARKSLASKLAAPFLADSTWSLSFLGALVLTASIVGQAMLFHATTGKFLDKATAEEELAHTTFEVLVEEKEDPKEEEKPVVDIMSDKAKEETKKEIDQEKKPDKKAPAVEKPESTGKTIDPEEKQRNAREAVVKNTVAGALVGANGAATKLFADGGEGEEGTVTAKFGGGDSGDGAGAGGPGGGGLKLEGGGGGGGTVEKVRGQGGGFGERKADVAKVDAPVKKEPVAAVKLAGLDGDDGGDGTGKSDIAKKIAGRAAAVKACYEAALRDNPDVSGKVKVSFTVGTAGTITDVSVSGAEGGFKDCIEGKFKSIRGLPVLPAPKQFNQSFVFTKS